MCLTYSNPCSLLLRQSPPCPGLLSFYSQFPSPSTSKLLTLHLPREASQTRPSGDSPLPLLCVPLVWRLIHTAVLTHGKSLLFALNLHGHGLLPLRGHKVAKPESSHPGRPAQLPGPHTRPSQHLQTIPQSSQGWQKPHKLLCSPQHSLSAELSHFPQLKPVRITHQLPMPAPPVPGATILLPVSVPLTIRGTSHKWSHMVFVPG